MISNRKPLRIASLSPALTELILRFGLEPQLVAVSSQCQVSNPVAIVTETPSGGEQRPGGRLARLLAQEWVDVDLLLEQSPDVVVTLVGPGVELPGPSSSIARRVTPEITLSELQSQLQSLTSTDKPRLFAARPERLEQIYAMIEDLGKAVGAPAQGRERAQRLKAQCMDWASNFYDRMKNKRVVVFSSVEPLTVAGLWMPDLVSLCSCTYIEANPGQPDKVITPAELAAFRPDTILVAPRGMSLADSARTMKTLSSLDVWESLPAAKRGEVVFADGSQLFYQPSYALVDSMAVLISAIAGLESGYITPRDSFYRLRWLELHRHKFNNDSGR